MVESGSHLELSLVIVLLVFISLTAIGAAFFNAVSQSKLS
jgi:hypothetical protein